MYGTLAMFLALLVIAGLLVLMRPGTAAPVEPFAVAAVNSILVPACTERSTAAQSLLSRVATVETTEANQGDKEELRLLVSKLCCFEADINTPAAGTYRTLPLQFRTAHDMEPASTLVGRCLRDSLRPRDIELIMEKFERRGKELVARVVDPSELVAATSEFLNITASLRAAMQGQCLVKQPRLDTPAGPRDIGFWESQKVGGLAEYKGISASP